MQPTSNNKTGIQHTLGWCLVAVVLGVMIYAVLQGIPSGGIEREPAEEAPRPEALPSAG
jgi:hypothetical protein